MRTFGGYSEDEAWHWNPETYLIFGAIVQDLTSGKAELRRKGFGDYYEFKRHFLLYEFDNKITELEAFRNSKKAPSLLDIIDEIGNQFVKNKHPLDAPQSSPLIPDFIPTTITNKIPKSQAKNDACEQLSFL